MVYLSQIVLDNYKLTLKPQELLKQHNTLRKISKERQSTDKFRAKELAYVTGLQQLHDITKKSLHSSNLITAEDRDFLFNHWDQTISTTGDMGAFRSVERRMNKKNSYQSFAERQQASTPTSSRLDLSISSQEELNSSAEPYKPVVKKNKQTGTTLQLDADIITKTGLAADRLNMTSTHVTGYLASLINNSGGNVDDIVLSKSLCIRQRGKARSQKSQAIKESFECKDTCQINFDGKLMKDLPGHKLGKINRLAVTLIQESGPKILSISKTDDSTGEGKARRIVEILEEWNVDD